MQEGEKKNGVKKWLLIGTTLVVIVLITLFAILRFAKDSSVAVSIGKVLPFGQLSDETPRGAIGDIHSIDPGNTVVPSGNNTGEQEPLFRQLTNRPIAGATTIVRDGNLFVRYVLRENGNVYEINTQTWATTQLTNTTIPQVHEAFFGDNGDTIVFRFAIQDRYTGLDVIKTYVGSIIPSIDPTTDTVGEIRGEYLVANISAVSISPDGTTLFYLTPTLDGTIGFIKKLNSALAPKEVLRSTFSEWLPQLFNDGTVMLSTKPSADIPGFAYLYDPTNKSMTRLVREKKGLTTLGSTPSGLVLYGENINGNATLGLHSEKGFPFDEGVITHEVSLPITAIPEKCVWGIRFDRLYCGSFSNDIRAKIPDDWYQGSLSFTDTFWMVNPSTQEVKLLAEPQREVHANFDVMNPFINNDETRLFFTDKNTGFLWSMRLIRPEEETTSTPDLPPPPPEEAGDAAGSL